jgi:hypothetical protein
MAKDIPKPSDYKIFQAYTDKWVREYFALNMIGFSYSYFLKTTRILEYSKLNDLYSSGRLNDRKFIEQFLLDNRTLILDSLIDDIKISIAFENYLKAKLLLNGFFVHNVNKDRNETQYKNQKKRPIESNTLNITEEFECPELLNRTLDYGFLLDKPKYTPYYNLDSEIINYLKEINNRRNNLHFSTNITFRVNQQEFDKLTKLKNLVECEIAILANELKDSLGAKNSSKLPVKCS